MDKLKMHSPNLTDENVAKIRDLFPGCVTEAADETGKLRWVVDFDQLRQELSDHIVEGPNERYHLNWPGKREALAISNAPIAKTLRPVREQSVDFDLTKNIFVEGDNLEALKLLRDSYLGKVKMIYIDPPYNTGNDFIYDDDFSEDVGSYLEKTRQRDDEGSRLVANTSANGRFHSDWLSFIMPRIRRARDFLTEDGAIFISINDAEYDNLRKVCSEVFGEDNFVCSFIWKSRQIIDSRNKTNSSSDHEYIIVFARDISIFQLLGKSIDQSKYSNPDNDPRGPWMSNSILGLAAASQRPNLHYDLVDPGTGRSFSPPADSGWRYSRDTIATKISDKRIIFPKKDDGRPREKKFQSELKGMYTGFSSHLSEDVGFTLNGSRELRDIMGDKYFDFPKPVSLIQVLIEQCTPQKDGIILDFFAGSATTAHAVLAQNAADGGNRKFIMVQIPEQTDEKSEAYTAGYETIAEISKERVRRAGLKLKGVGCHSNWNGDVGFRVLKIDTSNMQEVFYRPDEVGQADLLAAVDNIKPDRTPEDLLFQVLVDWGVDLTLPIRREKIHGKTVFFVDDNALAACFDSGVTEDLVKELAGHVPLRMVFRDNGFVSDAVKINVEQIFRQLSPNTDIKSI